MRAAHPGRGSGWDSAPTAEGLQEDPGKTGAAASVRACVEAAARPAVAHGGAGAAPNRRPRRRGSLAASFARRSGTSGTGSVRRDHQKREIASVRVPRPKLLLGSGSWQVPPSPSVIIIVPKLGKL